MKAFPAPFDVLGTEPSAGGEELAWPLIPEPIWAVGIWSVASARTVPRGSLGFSLPLGNRSATAGIRAPLRSGAPQASSHRFHSPGPPLRGPWVYLAVGLISRY